MLWEICSWETLGPAIHLDVILARSTYLSIVPDHVQFFMEKDLFQQDNAPQMLWFRSSLRSTTTRLKLDLSSEFSRSQSSQASVRCAGQTSLIHGAPPCNLQGLNDLLLTWTPPDSSGVWWSPCPDGSGLRWQQKIRLCLISVN